MFGGMIASTQDRQLARIASGCGWSALHIVLDAVTKLGSQVTQRRSEKSSDMKARSCPRLCSTSALPPSRKALVSTRYDQADDQVQQVVIAT
jgi:hypothetical protein